MMLVEIGVNTSLDKNDLVVFAKLANNELVKILKFTVTCKAY
ncbi:hypothetical protein THOG11_20035 [Vibrio harveyi]|nr:hypothetical protein TH15OA1_530360 [Vibrio harveyi]CAH1554449.1 hypothetical protein THOD03_20035 [Vibrio harveyi]CAH1561178.1 hypothetical protein THOG11_20035 [Vibrio harveyi]